MNSGQVFGAIKWARLARLSIHVNEQQVATSNPHGPRKTENLLTDPQQPLFAHRGRRDPDHLDPWLNRPLAGKDNPFVSDANNSPNRAAIQRRIVRATLPLARA